MGAEQPGEQPRPVGDPESLLQLKDQLFAAWRQLPTDHQATIALTLVGEVMAGEQGPWLREAIDLQWPQFDNPLIWMISLLPEREGEAETLDPRHFYAAFIFDKARKRYKDVATVVNDASQFGRPVRYWWLSETMNLAGFPDRLIVCVHHPSAAADAGMDLYKQLKADGASWDGLEAAHVDEYRELGKPVAVPDAIYDPEGLLLYPPAEEESRTSFDTGWSGPTDTSSIWLAAAFTICPIAITTICGETVFRLQRQPTRHYLKPGLTDLGKRHTFFKHPTSFLTIFQAYLSVGFLDEWREQLQEEE